MLTRLFVRFRAPRRDEGWEPLSERALQIAAKFPSPEHFSTGEVPGKKALLLAEIRERGQAGRLGELKAVHTLQERLFVVRPQ